MKSLAAVFAPLTLLLLSACGSLGDPVVEVPLQPPRIVYDASMTFFKGTLDARSVNSTGGPISAYTVSPALPAGLSLDPLTGEVSGAAAASPEDTLWVRYQVTATGPGGTGTAAFDLRVHDLVLDSGSAKPRIRYETPVFDTLGKAASHVPISEGGPVVAYAIHPAPPPGLAFNATTGRISGKPTVARAAADYTVIASGPGGRDTAVVRLAVAASFARPDIAYATPFFDTTYKPARHVPSSTGGPVTSYALLQPDDAADMLLLPPGLSLDPATGVISGTPIPLLRKSSLTLPENLMSSGTYSIVASGPGGKDTAAIQILIFHIPLVGPPDPVVPNPTSTLQLSIGLDSIRVPLSHLVVTLRSNASAPADAPVIDTLWSGMAGVGTLGTAGQKVTKSYAVKPLRNWTITVLAHALNGTPLRGGYAVAPAMKVAETRTVSVDVSTIVIVNSPDPAPLP